MLGVSHTTVQRDTNVSEEPPKRTKETKEESVIDTNVSPPRSVEIRRCDFRELLGSLTDVDAIITDPPYERMALPRPTWETAIAR